MRISKGGGTRSVQHAHLQLLGVVKHVEHRLGVLPSVFECASHARDDLVSGGDFGQVVLRSVID
jgi:hypothetical protein